MTTPTNGLDALMQQRDKSKSARTVPPSRRPAPAVAPAAPTAAGKPAETPPAAPAIAAAPLIRSTIHVDAEVDDFLESVRSVGRRRAEKVDATRSAVVRLAVQRLAVQLSADQVVDELAKRGPAGTGIGRPRR